jgi:hypothetical protein
VPLRGTIKAKTKGISGKPGVKPYISIFVLVITLVFCFDFALILRLLRKSLNSFSSLTVIGLFTKTKS